MYFHHCRREDCTGKKAHVSSSIFPLVVHEAHLPGSIKEIYLCSVTKFIWCMTAHVIFHNIGKPHMGTGVSQKRSCGTASPCV